MWWPLVHCISPNLFEYYTCMRFFPTLLQFLFVFSGSWWLFKTPSWKWHYDLNKWTYKPSENQRNIQRWGCDDIKTTGLLEKYPCVNQDKNGKRQVEKSETLVMCSVSMNTDRNKHAYMYEKKNLSQNSGVWFSLKNQQKMNRESPATKNIAW